MSLYKANRIEFDGNKNTVLQDVHADSIIINTGLPEEIEKLVADIGLWINRSKNSCLNILVISTSIEKLNEVDNCDTRLLPLDYYGDEPKDWRPFGDKETILTY